MDWEDYFYDIVGVTRPEGVDVKEIVFKFTSVVAPYIITKPLHPSQKHKSDSTGLEVMIKVIPNFELEKLILSFAEQVEVVSPQNFKDHIANRLHSANEIYCV